MKISIDLFNCIHFFFSAAEVEKSFLLFLPSFVLFPLLSFFFYNSNLTSHFVAGVE